MKNKIFKRTFSILAVAALLAFPVRGFPAFSKLPALLQGQPNSSDSEEIWQSDQMDIEYPIQEQPTLPAEAGPHVDDSMTTDLTPFAAAWQSDQMDIEYPIQEQPGTRSGEGQGPHQGPSLNRPLMIATWQSDQMDIEYPIQEQPRDGTGVNHWTPGDHLKAATRYEEDARLLQAEVRGMEQAIGRLLPHLEVKTIRQAGVLQLLARQEREAEKKADLAQFHRMSGIDLLENGESDMKSTEPDHIPEGVSSATHSSQEPTWIEDEAILGW